MISYDVHFTPSPGVTGISGEGTETTAFDFLQLGNAPDLNISLGILNTVLSSAHTQWMLSDLQGEICDSQWLPISLVLYGEFGIFHQSCRTESSLTVPHPVPPIVAHSMGYPAEHKPHITTGYLICGVPCWVKTWGPFFRIIMNFKIMTAKHQTQHGALCEDTDCIVMK